MKFFFHPADHIKTSIKVNGYTSMLLLNLQRETTFMTFNMLFRTSLSRLGSTFKEKTLLPGEPILFLQELTCTNKGGKNENDSCFP